MSSDAFAKVAKLPPDAIFFLSGRAKAAQGPKADLVIGAYRDEKGLPHPLQVVRKAERILLEKNLDYEYQPIAGHAGFIDVSLKLLYGDAVDRQHVVGVQTLSGTGAVMTGAFFLSRVVDRETAQVYISDPTWPNHRGIFNLAGFKNVKTYRYYNPKTVGLDFEGFKKDVLAAPEGSIFVLHECAHNPTGVDPTHAQWAELADLFLQKKHYVLMDSAYQGYASGSLDNDAFAARLFVKKGIQVMGAQSFSKNLGLYNERIGTFSVVVKDATVGAAVKSNLEAIIRANYSNPPAHGARLVHLILSDNTLRKEWEGELRGMAERIKRMRRTVYNLLKKQGTPGSWEHIVNQIGMFSYLGLTKEQCEYCQSKNVFITLTARANMAGLTDKSCVLLAKTIDEAVREVPAGAKSKL